MTLNKLNKINSLGIGFSSSQSWASYWRQRLYDDFATSIINTSKWTATNPNPWDGSYATSVAGYEQKDNSLIQHSYFGSTGNQEANNIKSLKVQDIGYWIFPMLDVRILPNAYHGGNPVNKRSWGLIDSTQQNGIIFFRSPGDTANLSYKILQSGIVKYTYNSTIPYFALIKIHIDSSYNIKIYQLINDTWSQMGTTNTYSLGNLSVFFNSDGTNATKTQIGAIYIYSNESTIQSNNYPVTKEIGYVDAREYGAVPDGITDCSDAINSGLSIGNVILKNGVFKYTASLKLRSNNYLKLKNAVLIQADSNYDNFFRNSDFVNGNTNVNVLGEGCAILDANFANNNDGYATYGPIGNPPPDNVYRYWASAFVNVTNWRISGLTMVDYMHWGFVSQATSQGILDNIYLSMITKGNYNQDGFPLIYGNNNIVISNVRGYTGDDFISMGNGKNIPMAVKIDNWQVGNLYNISYSNIYQYNAGQRSFGIFGGDGNKIYNISWDNIFVDSCSSYFFANLPSVCIAPPLIDDIYSLTFNNVTIEHCATAGLFYMQNPGKDVIFTNFTNNTGQSVYYTRINWSADIQSFIINDVYYPEPALVSSTVENSVKDEVVDTYDRLMDDNTIPAISAYILSGGKNVIQITINKINKTVTRKADSAYAYGDVITEDYVVPVNNKLRAYLAGNAEAYSGRAVINNIVGSYPLTDIIGRWDILGNPNDTSGNSYNLTDNNGVLAVDSHSVADRSYDLVPASSAYLYRSAFTEANVNEFTGFIRFKLDALTNNTWIYGNGNTATWTSGWALVYISATTSLRFWINGWNTAGRFVNLLFSDISGWHTVVFSYKPTAPSANIWASLDGGTAQTSDYTVNPSYVGANFYIGRASIYMDGKVECLGLWSKEKTLSEKSFLSTYNHNS